MRPQTEFSRWDIAKIVGLLLIAGGLYYFSLKLLTIDRLKNRGVEIRLDGQQRVYAIILEGDKFANSDLAVATRVDSVEQVQLLNTQIDDEGLLLLQRFPNLKRVELSSKIITNRGIESLAELPQLAAIAFLDLPHVTHECLYAFQGHRELKLMFGFQTMSINIQEVHRLQAALPDVELQFPSSSIVRIPEQSRLRISNWNRTTYEIAISYGNGTDEVGRLEPGVLSEITSPECVTSLNLAAAEFAPHAFKEIARFKNLAWLSIRSAVDEQELAILRELPDLRTLWMGGPPVSDAQLAILPSKLETLSIGCRQLTTATVGELARIEPLKELFIRFEEPQQPALEELARLTHLKQLELSGVDVEDRDIERLRGLNELETLWVPSDKLTTAVLETLLHFPNLHYVSLYESQIPEAMIQHFDSQLQERYLAKHASVENN